ncbi:myosin-17-like [Dorcoceras hygrometricum]|uniref:Myosin-17-like n=1 Tax=Dorcoceras hygrometricum TaxID=472368 RepID=A0A2Z7BWC0_9LAMI|nr:myosin-17-like [Dorcoceras hygrometricum]
MTSTRSESKLEVLEKTLNEVQGNVDDMQERMSNLTKEFANMADSQARMEMRIEHWMNNTRGHTRRGGVDVENVDEEEKLGVLTGSHA